MPGKNPLARSDVDWQTIRALHNRGASLKGLSDVFGVAYSTIQERAKREGWRMRRVPGSIALHDKPTHALLTEADHSLAIAFARFSSHLSRMDTRFFAKHVNQIKTLLELRDRLTNNNESQVGRKNGKQKANGSPNYFAADANQLAELTRSANGSGPDIGSGEASREILND